MHTNIYGRVKSIYAYIFYVCGYFGFFCIRVRGRSAAALSRWTDAVGSLLLTLVFCFRFRASACVWEYIYPHIEMHACNCNPIAYSRACG